MSDALKAIFTPGSLEFLLPCLMVWAVLKYGWPRNRKIGRGWLGLVGGTYLALSLPFVATAIVNRLPLLPQADVASLRGIDMLIVLGGDNRAGRAKEAVRVYQAAKPGAVLVLNSGSIYTTLVRAGIPRERLRATGGPGTTLTQIVWLRRFLRPRLDARIALVASRVHMPRVAALAKGAGLTLTPVPSPLDAEPATTGVWRFVPSFSALGVTRDALYEHAALAYYGWRGWIGPP